MSYFLAKYILNIGFFTFSKNTLNGLITHVRKKILNKKVLITIKQTKS